MPAFSGARTAPGHARRLVVAYAFAPYADTSAVAATKRVATQGRQVDVVANAMDSLRGVDPSLDEVVTGLVQRRAHLSTPTRFAGWSSIESFVRHGRETVRRWEETGAGYSSLYSRAHFIASHLLSAVLVGERPGLSWEAEISDPLSRSALGGRRTGPVPRGELGQEWARLLAGRGVQMPEDATVYEWAETLAYVLADEVVFTAAGQLEHCLSLVGDDRVRGALEQRAVVRPHATLPAEFYTRRAPVLELDPGRVHIGYFGGFYASQDPGSLLRAVAAMAPQDRDRVRLHLFTGADGVLVDQVAQHGVGDVVRVRDRLPFLDFLSATRRMDVLLAIDAAPVPGEKVPHVRLSKMSDYLGSGTPVWGMVTPGSELAGERLALRTPVGHLTATLQALTGLARRPG